jgi:hypothetical protein
LEAARPWERFEIRDHRLIDLGHDSGVAFYSVVVQRPGEEPYAAVVSSTVVRDHDEWKLAFHQQSPTFSPG